MNDDDSMKHLFNRSLSPADKYRDSTTLYEVFFNKEIGTILFAVSYTAFLLWLIS